MSSERHVSDGDLESGVRGRTGMRHVLHVVVPKGEIHVVVRDHFGIEPVGDEPYTLGGPHGVSQEGRTSEHGAIDRDEPCPIDHYTLAICEKTFVVDSRPHGLPPVIVRVPDWPAAEPAEEWANRGEEEPEDMGELHVVVRDHFGIEPLANERFTVRGHGISFEGTTDEHGAIDRAEPCPIGHYELTLLDTTFTVDSRPRALSPVVVRVPDVHDRITG